jgi:TM2 domain-containing membrane protein YozV
MSISEMPDYAATSPVNAAQPGGGADVHAMMMFEANKTEVCVAYLLWFFLGYFGAHNFYLKRTGVAVVQLILTLTLIGMLIVFFWHLVDAFLIPGWVRRNNNALALSLGATPFYAR